MLLSDAVQALDALLVRCLDRDRAQLGTAGRFKQTVGIGAIGLAAQDVGPYLVRRQQRDPMSQPGEAPRPVVRGAAGLHDHVQRRLIVQAAGKLRSRQPLTVHDPAGSIGEGELEHVLGEVDGDRGRGGGIRRSMHGGLLP